MARPRRTHCKRGHALTDDNVYLIQTDQRVIRQCKACKALSYKRNKPKKMSHVVQGHSNFEAEEMMLLNRIVRLQQALERGDVPPWDEPDIRAEIARLVAAKDRFAKTRTTVLGQGSRAG